MDASAVKCVLVRAMRQTDRRISFHRIGFSDSSSMRPFQSIDTGTPHQPKQTGPRRRVVVVQERKCQHDTAGEAA